MRRRDWHNLTRMADIKISAPAGVIDGVLELPSADGKRPGVVVVHDALGLGTDVRNITRRIANAGFLAITPDLYSRGGRARCIQRVMRDVIAGKGDSFDDILAARDQLIARPDCTGKVGVVGFCLGGGFALVLSPKGFAASAPFYPSILPFYDKMVDGACPIVASFGSRDPINIGSGEKLRKVLERKGIEHDIRTYDGVGHSFANEMPLQPVVRIVGFGYNEAATNDAFGRVFEFFGKHLGR